MASGPTNASNRPSRCIVPTPGVGVGPIGASVGLRLGLGSDASKRALRRSDAVFRHTVLYKY